MKRVLAPLFLVVLAGCGGGGGSDQEDAEKTVREFIQASNARDAGKLCDDLLSQQFVEQTTLATGDKAREACKRQYTQLKAARIELIDIQRAEVDGDKARVMAVLEVQGQRANRVFRLVEADGRWRLAGGSE
jgi:ketosteroid isomerase-like protein